MLPSTMLRVYDRVYDRAMLPSAVSSGPNGSVEWLGTGGREEKDVSHRGAERTEKMTWIVFEGKDQ